jgi:hypothetical protein
MLEEDWLVLASVMESLVEKVRQMLVDDPKFLPVDDPILRIQEPCVLWSKSEYRCEHWKKSRAV